MKPYHNLNYRIGVHVERRNSCAGL